MNTCRLLWNFWLFPAVPCSRNRLKMFETWREQAMGNFCSSRSDPDESRQQYEKYTFLRQQILSKLSDEVLANECGHLYAEECRRRRVTSLSKATWEEVGLPFIMRVSCNDPQTQHRIWQAVEEVYPGPPERPVNQATFVEFHRLALTLAEQDLRQRIAKVKEKYGGVAPPIPNSDWMSELFGKDCFLNPWVKKTQEKQTRLFDVIWFSCVVPTMAMASSI